MLKNKIEIIKDVLKLKMRDILGRRYTVNDEYQREYKWKKEHIEELMRDFTDRFNKDRNLSYFLGTIILVDNRDGTYDIVDGQQRITTILLLLLALYHRLKKPEKDEIYDSIAPRPRSDKHLHVIHNPKTKSYMDALFSGDEKGLRNSMRSKDNDDDNGTINKMNARYENIKSELNELEEAENQKVGWGDKDFYDFAVWIMENVNIAVITVTDKDDAFAIFETMNDRGLQIDEVEKIKGYILTNINEDTDEDLNEELGEEPDKDAQEEGNGESKREQAKVVWLGIIKSIQEVKSGEPIKFIKAWFKGRYARDLEEGNNVIGRSPYKWLRARNRGGTDNPTIFIESSTDSLYEFVNSEMCFYSKWYTKLRECADDYKTAIKDNNFEKVFYNAGNLSFDLWEPLLLSTLRSTENANNGVVDEDRSRNKIRLLSEWLDITLARRIWASESTRHDSMRSEIYNVMVELRKVTEAEENPKNEIEKMRKILTKNLHASEPSFREDFSLTEKEGNSKKVRAILARLTLHVEISTNTEKDSDKSEEIRLYKRYTRQEEVEHVFVNDYSKYGTKDRDFNDALDFSEYRRHIGSLLLLPKSINAKLNYSSPEEKFSAYSTQTNNNPLAKSFCANFYEKNAKFAELNKLLGRSGRESFQFYGEAKPDERRSEFYGGKKFGKEQIKRRTKLYGVLAEQIWDPKNLEKIS